MANAVQAVRAAQAASEGCWGVPWITWSGLIGAAVVSGVAAFTTKTSSKNSLRRLASQHTRGDAEAERQRKHDAKQKDEDHKGAIRMEVYVKAIEATHALLGACRAWGFDSEKRLQRGQFLLDLPAHSSAMRQKNGERWAAATTS